MKKQIHILNGDVLRESFSENIQGEIIVARECLIDGDLDGDNLNELFQTRAQFISGQYKVCSEQEYYDEAVSEFEKIQIIPEDVEINLWFEDDLFCQVNFWFVTNLLIQSERSNPVFLVRPKPHAQYNFGLLSESELMSIYEQRQIISDPNKFANLWDLYQKNKTEKLLNAAKEMENNYPFVLPVVEAHVARIPSSENLGRTSQTLIQIVKDLNTEELEPVLKEFTKRENIYGFGDLQVKRLLEQTKNYR